ncbi:histidyl-tRNA synthetase [Nematocida displodere]|uniref:histidine--tRNA ligase n=1 Tax=Nematocida displodere TaxID=1805483 RepID=A0A177EAU8_9MICR|nr:histidyl-tRNA synthetase [Nematocida displodere]
MENLKTPKGTRDYAGEERILLESIIKKTEDIYKARGGVPFDTPTFEIKSVLTNKYGEDSKLIYDLADQGGESCALRYDLTVPLARYLGQTKTLKMKRYQTGKVFRRDQPIMNKGRYREFFQSDFDIVGEYERMAADAEIVSSACEILKSFSEMMDNRAFELRINHRGLVDAIMEVCGIPAPLHRAIGSAVDKLDKLSWADVRCEMAEKGACDASIDKLAEYIKMKGPLSLIAQLKATEISNTPEGAQSLNDLERLYELLIVYGIDECVTLDLSLIRGLDYYTGLLLEGGYAGGEGSVIAGGRYDKLVSSMQEKTADTLAGAMASATIKKKTKPLPSVPCVGVSLGVSRLFGMVAAPSRRTYVDVLVCSVGAGLFEERMRTCVHLRKQGICAEYFMGTSGNFSRHSEYAELHGIPFLVLFGRKELEAKEYQIIWGERNDRQKQTVSLEELPAALRALIGQGSSV